MSSLPQTEVNSGNQNKSIWGTVKEKEIMWQNKQTNKKPVLGEKVNG